MCILYIIKDINLIMTSNDNSSSSRSSVHYDIILASNRDEMFSRETIDLSQYIMNDKMNATVSVLCGVDVIHGGTWLGVNDKGMIVALTNNREVVGKHTKRVQQVKGSSSSSSSNSNSSYNSTSDDVRNYNSNDNNIKIDDNRNKDGKDKRNKSRGMIVTNLLSSIVTLDEVINQANEYSFFNVITIDIKTGSIHYYGSNDDHDINIASGHDYNSSSVLNSDDHNNNGLSNNGHDVCNITIKDDDDDDDHKQNEHHDDHREGHHLHNDHQISSTTYHDISNLKKFSLSNGTLFSNWPKMKLGLQLLDQQVGVDCMRPSPIDMPIDEKHIDNNNDNAYNNDASRTMYSSELSLVKSILINVLMNKQHANVDELPMNTVLNLDMEYLLSSIFVQPIPAKSINNSSRSSDSTSSSSSGSSSSSSGNSSSSSSGSSSSSSIEISNSDCSRTNVEYYYGTASSSIVLATSTTVTFYEISWRNLNDYCLLTSCNSIDGYIDQYLICKTMSIL